MKFILKIVLVFSISLYSTTVFCQNSTNVPYSFDQIVIEQNKDGEFIYTHNIRKGETVYRLARIFGLKSKDLFDYNPKLKNTIISIGAEVKIPISSKLIYKEVHLGDDFKNAIPVVYRVKAKENLFRISRVYFDQQIINMVKRNKLEGMDLSIGQSLTVGWILKDIEEPKAKPVATKEQKKVFENIIKKGEVKNEGNEIDGQNEESIVEVGKKEVEVINSIREDEPGIEEKVEPKVKKNKKEKASKEAVAKKPVYKVKKTKGLAIWKKDSADTENLFALHPTALVNSMIEITNPMLNRKVYAKIIGNLPKNSYPDSVILVVTPQVASELGVIDTRFFVEIRYLE